MYRFCGCTAIKFEHLCIVLKRCLTFEHKYIHPFISIICLFLSFYIFHNHYLLNLKKMCVRKLISALSPFSFLGDNAEEHFFIILIIYLFIAL